MERCETCRFWTETGEWIAEASSDRFDDWQVCARAYSNHDHGLEARMRVTAADDYDLALWTAPDFGCTEWQAIGAGIPTLLQRHGFVVEDGRVLSQMDNSLPAPDFAADFTGLIKSRVEDFPADRPISGRGLDEAPNQLSAFVAVTAIGQEVLEQAWAEAIQLAHQNVTAARERILAQRD